MAVRLLDPTREDEIHLVAARMRATLVDVLGEARGAAMYDLPWLVDRVRFHLAPDRRVWLAVADDGEVVGHAIARVEVEDDVPHAWFSTIYVAPDARRHGHGAALMAVVEAWARSRGLDRVRYATAIGNDRLLRLFIRDGYVRLRDSDEMTLLEKRLGAAPV